MNPLFFAYEYIRHRLRSMRQQRWPEQLLIWRDRIIRDRREFYAFQEIEKARRQLLMEERPTDRIGAPGSQGGLIPLNRLVYQRSIPPMQGRFLFRVAVCVQPMHTLELGTAAGISSAYMAAAGRRNMVVTIDRNAALTQVAKDLHRNLNLQNVSVRRGDFDTVLKKVAYEASAFDLAFIDGYHREEPTLGYFETLASRSSLGSVLLFHDIHWSREMHRAWRKIKRDPNVSASIDLFWFGVIILGPESPVHLTARLRDTDLSYRIRTRRRSRS